jgi:6-phosphogluconolactonase
VVWARPTRLGYSARHGRGRAGWRGNREGSGRGGRRARAAARIARRLSEAVRTGGSASLALSGGKTPLDTYEQLSRAAGVDWSKLRIFWVDERAVAPDSERSNYRAARSTLIERAHIADDRVHRMCAERPDREAAAVEYEALLRRFVGAATPGTPPSLDAIVLGMGADGHTASLFPGNSSAGVSDRLVVAVPSVGGLEPRLTFTPAVIRAARSVFVIVVGAEKRPALARAWAEAGDESDTPIRVVRSCLGAVTWIVDRAAAG